MNERIAIVGRALAVPGASSGAQFWANILAAQNEARPPSPGRWVLAPDACHGEAGNPDQVSSRHGCFLDPFDPPALPGLDPEAIARLDPMFHLALRTGAQAWADAGQRPGSLVETSVIIGNILLPTAGCASFAGHHLDALERRLPRPHAVPAEAWDTQVGGAPAALLARGLGLTGASYTLDAACASSLYALKLGCDELRRGRVKAVIAGGMSHADALYTQMGFSQLRALSPSGHCRPFDADADGLVVGEGGAMFVLMRESDAREAGLAVYAFIAGIGVSNDVGGRLMAPDSEGQLRAMRSAYHSAGWTPWDVGLIECHGTGTPVGDTAEVTSLRALWHDAPAHRGAVIGSVKGNIGHLLTGAGAAGVFKMLLALEHRTLPPTAGFRQAPRGTDLGQFEVLNTARPWSDSTAMPRCAVSAFGFGGINAHILLEPDLDGPGESHPLLPRREPAAVHTSPAIAVVGVGAHFGSYEDRGALALALSSDGASDGAGTREPTDLRHLVHTVALPATRLRTPPTELRDALAQQLLMLRVSAEALDDAGCDTGQPDPRLGVFIGTSLDLNTTDYTARWRALAARRSPEGLGPALSADRTMGALGSISASRVARAFNAGGPAFTVSSGEISVYTALALACTALEDGEIDTAVVGAVDLAGDPRAVRARELIGPSQTPAGDGAGALVLMRADDAAASGRSFYALVEPPTLTSHDDQGALPNSQPRDIARDDSASARLVAERLGFCGAAHGMAVLLATLGKLPERGADSVVVSTALATAAHCHLRAPAGNVRALGEVGPTASPKPARTAFANRSLARDLARARRAPHAPTTHEPGENVSPAPFGAIEPNAAPAATPAPSLAGSSTIDLAPLLASQSAVQSVAQSGHQSRQEPTTEPLTGRGPPPPASRAGPRHDLVRAIERANHAAGETHARFLSMATDTTRTIAHLSARQRARSGAAAPGTSRARRPRQPNPGDLVGAAHSTESPTRDAVVGPSATTVAREPAGAIAPSLSSGQSSDPSSDPSSAGAWDERADVAAPAHATAIAADVPRALDRWACLRFAVGDIASVLGPRFAPIDRLPSRVRLPDEPLMLVDRITAIDGEPCSLAPGRVVTEHDVLPGAWYLDAGRIPTCVAVEAGQADLFLGAFLGIDFHTRGEGVYRLLDAAVTFQGPLPQAGAVLRYDIRITRFFRLGSMHLFRFEFDATADGQPLMQMRDGCAGFFSPEELASGRGLVQGELEQVRSREQTSRPSIDWHLASRPVAIERYDEAALDALREADLVSAFGAEFGHRPTDRFVPLPGDRMRLVHRITHLDAAGGRFERGLVIGEADIAGDEWFLTCHFPGDEVMPGTLMYECCLHTLRVFLLRFGWTTPPGAGPQPAFEPIPGVTSRLRCRGQVVESTDTVQYEIHLRHLDYDDEGTPVAIADAVMCADQRPIVYMENLCVRLTGVQGEDLRADWRTRWRTRWQARDHSPPDARCPDQPLFGYERILEFASGRPSAALGPAFAAFDHGRHLARLPRPPYGFIHRVVDLVDGQTLVLRPGAKARALYDSAAGNWYYGQYPHHTMPYAILLEVGLQPCGWLAAYLGAALTSEQDLYFRNLDGSATVHAPIPEPPAGRNIALQTDVHLLDVSRAGSMIIVKFDLRTSAAGVPVLEANTTFGFFTADALARQAGIADGALAVYDPQRALDVQGAAPVLTAGVPATRGTPPADLALLDELEIFDPGGGAASLGYLRASTAVEPERWYFHAHFFEDPVCPGSLGLEAFVQLLRVAAKHRWGDDHEGVLTPGASHQWSYRGQILPTNRRYTVEATVTAVDDRRRTLVADGLLAVDGLVIYRMQRFSLSSPPVR